MSSTEPLFHCSTDRRPQMEWRAGKAECEANGASARSVGGGRGPAAHEAVGWVQGEALVSFGVRGGAIAWR